jgi:hypothetical protein
MNDSRTFSAGPQKTVEQKKTGERLAITIASAGFLLSSVNVFASFKSVFLISHRIYHSIVAISMKN